MTGIELAVGLVAAWAVRKAKRVAGRADAEADLVLDAGMDRVHEVVAARLGKDPALEQAMVEAASEQGEVTGRTRTRLQLALEEQTEQDPGFAAELRKAVEGVQAAAAEAAPGARAVYGNTFNGPTAIQSGDHNTQHNTFGS
ncbi:hypothetical protein [Streptomyces sp. NBC_00986]|uniref:hypothetical protein n=1 Tax=Streptomyces sp. NBC_00986 TaxID=2903702 RepID=UPI00386B0612|nr:hypothetical protein OG504_51400 [Streptomyces sp. NBC_00986]